MLPINTLSTAVSTHSINQSDQPSLHSVAYQVSAAILSTKQSAVLPIKKLSTSCQYCQPDCASCQGRQHISYQPSMSAWICQHISYQPSILSTEHVNSCQPSILSTEHPISRASYQPSILSTEHILSTEDLSALTISQACQHGSALSA